MNQLPPAYRRTANQARRHSREEQLPPYTPTRNTYDETDVETEREALQNSVNEIINREPRYKKELESIRRKMDEMTSSLKGKTIDHAPDEDLKTFVRLLAAMSGQRVELARAYITQCIHQTTFSLLTQCVRTLATTKDAESKAVSRKVMRKGCIKSLKRLLADEDEDTRTATTLFRKSRSHWGKLPSDRFRNRMVEACKAGIADLIHDDRQDFHFLKLKDYRKNHIELSNMHHDLDEGTTSVERIDRAMFARTHAQNIAMAHAGNHVQAVKLLKHAQKHAEGSEHKALYQVHLSRIGQHSTTR